MSLANDNSNYSSSPEVFGICRSLNDPSKATSTSLEASLSAIITTTLTCPMAVFVNGLVLLSFYKNSSLRRQAHVFLIALALADFLRSVLAFPSFILMEILYQKKVEPSCFLMVFHTNTGLFIQSELLLTAMNCGRFIGLRFPIWHRVHVTKRQVIKIAVVCFVIGTSVALGRSFAGNALLMPFMFFSFCSSAAMFMFAVLIWRVIKKRNQKKNIQDLHQQGQKQQPSTKPHEPSESVSRQALEGVEIPRLGVPENIEEETISVALNSKREEVDINQEQVHPQQGSKEQSECHGQDVPESADGPCISRRNSVKIVQGTRTDGVRQDDPQCQEKPQSSVQLNKSEIIVGKVAIYLTLGLLFSRIIPVILLSVVSTKFVPIYVVAPLLKTLWLSTSLVNPAIYISTNKEIRKACLKLLK